MIESTENNDFTEINSILNNCTRDEIDKLKDIYLKKRLKFMEKQLEVYKDADIIQAIFRYGTGKD